jgi:hypothetical protein
MLDFERWFQRQGQASPSLPAEDLADQLDAIGLDLHVDGSVWGDCCICKSRICLTDYMTAEECVRDADPHDLYCWGSPRCCP